MVVGALTILLQFQVAENRRERTEVMCPYQELAKAFTSMTLAFIHQNVQWPHQLQANLVTKPYLTTRMAENGVSQYRTGVWFKRKRSMDFVWGAVHLHHKHILCMFLKTVIIVFFSCQLFATMFISPNQSLLLCWQGS